MAAAPNRLKDQVRTVLGSLSRKAKVAISIAVIAAGGVLAYIVGVDHTEYAVLFAGLSTEDAARITEQMRKNKTPYQLEAGGSTIMVPSDKVHEVRLTLAGQGLPRGGGVGFEIFDTQKFGLSDFAQQVNYRRALQGELERTISQLDAVQAARVHIALPDRQVFARRTQPVSASVTLKLHPGRTLASGSVSAIVHLVSSAEPGLSPDQVTVVDTAGNMLWGGREGPMGSGGPLDYKHKQEDLLERRVREILDTALGPGRSVVKVTAEVVLSEVEQTETEYDPENVAIRSESSLEEKDARGTATAAGIPGVQANLPGGPAPTAGASEGASQRKSLTRNYEVTKTVRKKVSPAGELKRLSVAVLVDSAALAAPAAAKKAAGAKKGDSRPVDVRALEQVVRQAVGFSAQRGDVITLESIPFAPEQEIEVAERPWVVTYLIQNSGNVVKLLGGVIGGLILLVILSRALRQRNQGMLLELPRTVRELEASTAALAPAAAAAPRALPEPEPAGRALAKEAAAHDVARTASVLKAWIAEE